MLLLWSRVEGLDIQNPMYMAILLGYNKGSCNPCSTTTLFHNAFLHQLFEFHLESALVRMRNCESTRTVRCNRWISFKMDFLVCEGLEHVIEKYIKLGKELKEIFLLLWHEMSAQICDCPNITSFLQTIQYFHSKVIIKRESIFVILFVMVKTIL